MPSRVETAAPSTDVIHLLSLLRVPQVSWPFVAREAQKPGGLERLRRRRPLERSPEAERSLAALELAKGDLQRHREVVEEMLACTRDEGIGLTTVLDADYPANLRTIFNLPPFLFFRGALRPEDARAVAVVGTRQASSWGLSRARKLAALLVEHGVTVLSGLARGIDTAAHDECVLRGGRTIAVLGTGIRRTYPKENEALAERICDQGALVSQFWPDAPPMGSNFPRRNVVTSGLGQGTVVIEASPTSGAKMQARLALEHGKKVFLLKSLVESRPWARSYLERGAIRVEDGTEILRYLRSPEAVESSAVERRQLVLDVL
jgi:DNA processing protein